MKRLLTLIFVALILLTNGLFAQTFDSQSAVENFDSNMLEVYLDKADAQQSQEDWFRVAEYGIEAVTAKWESDILLVLGENADISGLKSEFENNINALVEKRLADFLTKQFFKKLDGPEVGKLFSEIDNNNLQYLYQTDDYDNILLDSDGSPMFKGSLGLFDVTTENGGVTVTEEGDKTKWTTSIKTTIDDIINSWVEKTNAEYSEVLNIIPENSRDSFSENFNLTLEQHKNGIRRELDHIYMKEQNRLVLSRMYDRNSLEYKTQQETANNVSQRLITDTEVKLNEGIEALMSGLEKQVGMVQTEGGVIDGDQWQESFRLLMEQGLQDWDKAEEQLLLERIEWERNVGDQMQASEEAWAESFKLLQEKRTEWFNKFRNTLEEGNQLWAEQGHELETVIGQAIVELDTNIENRKASLQNRMDNLVGMLLQSVNMMRTSRESYNYWMDKADSDDLGTFDQSKVGYDTWSMRIGILDEVMPDFHADRDALVADSIADINAANQYNTQQDINRARYVQSAYNRRLSQYSGRDAYEFERAYNNGWGWGAYRYIDEEKAKELYPYTHVPSYAQAYNNNYNEKSAGDQLFLKGVLSEDFVRHSFNWFQANNVPGKLKDIDVNIYFEDIYSSYGRSINKNTAREALNNTLSWFRGEYEISKANDDSFKEAIYWTEEVFTIYSKHSKETQEQLASTYGIVVFNDPAIASAFTADGDLQEALLSTDLLYDQDLWESLYLDDFQVELLKSRAYEQYWVKQVEIATEVLNYSKDNSSNKENADATLIKLHEAEEAYNNALAEYEAYVTQLEGIGNGITATQERIASIQQGISAYQDELAGYRSHYEDLVSQFYINNPDYLKDQYQGFYKELLAAKGLDPERTEDTLGTAMEEYFAAAHKYDLENQLSLVSNNLETLVNGQTVPIGTDKKSSSAFYSVSELKTLVTKIENFELNITGSEYLPADFLFSIENELELSMNDPYYMEFARLYEELKHSSNMTESRTAYQMVYVLEQVKKRAEGWLTDRMAEIRLISGNNFDAWFTDYYGDHSNLTTSGDKLNYIEQQKDYSEKRLIGDKITAELNLLEEMLTRYNSSAAPEDFYFYDWNSSDNAMPVKIADSGRDMYIQLQWDNMKQMYGDNHISELNNKVEALRKLKTFWDSLNGELLDNGDTIVNAIKNPEYLGNMDKEMYNYLTVYLEGGGMFISQMGDMGNSLIQDELDTISKNQKLYSLVEKHKYSAISLKKAVADVTWTDLSTLLQNNGLLNSSLSFKSPNQVWADNNFANAEEVYTWLENLEVEAGKLYPMLPEYVSSSVINYFKEVRDFCAVNMIKEFPGEVPLSSENIQNEILELVNKTGDANMALRTLQSTNTSELNKLLSLIETVPPGEELYLFIDTQLVETVALDLASKAAVDPFNGTPESLWAEYLSVQGIDPDLNGNTPLTPWKDTIIEKANSYIEIAKAIENPDLYNWSSATPEVEDYVKTAYWNTLGADEALKAAKENTGNIATYYEIVKSFETYTADNNIDTTSGLTAADLEKYKMDSIYDGDYGRSNTDQFLRDGGLANWTASDFNLFNTLSLLTVSSSQRNNLEGLNYIAPIVNKSADLIGRLTSPSSDDDVIDAFLALNSVASNTDEAQMYRDAVAAYRASGNNLNSGVLAILPPEIFPDSSNYTGEYGLLELTTYLDMLDKTFEGRGFYNSGVSRDELLRDLVIDAGFTADDYNFINSTLNKTIAEKNTVLTDWMDEKVYGNRPVGGNRTALNLNSQEGDDFFFTAMWMAKRESETNSNFSLDNFRTSHLHNNTDLTLMDNVTSTIDSWINEVNNGSFTWDSLYTRLTESDAGVLKLVDSTLLDFANDSAPGSELYRKALYMGSVDSLVNNSNLSVTKAKEVMNWFTQLTGTTPVSTSTFNYLNSSENEKTLSILNNEEKLHYYKTKILSKEAEQADWANESYTVKTELDAFWERVDFSRSYSSKLHGDINTYVKEKYPDDLSKQLEILNQETNSSGNAIRWDDPLFTAQVGADNYDTLSKISSLKTYGKTDVTFNGNETSSVTTSGGNRSIYDYSMNYLSNVLTETNTKLQQLSVRKTFVDRAVEINSDFAGATKKYHWRTLLTNDFLYSANNLEMNGPGEGIIVDATTDDRPGRDITIDESGDNNSAYEIVYATEIDADGNEVQVTKVLNRAEEDIDNWYLDEYNDMLDSASYLTASLETWISGSNDTSEQSNKYNWLSGNFDSTTTINETTYNNMWDYLETKTKEDIRDDLKFFNSESIEYFKAKEKVNNLLGSIEHFKTEMSRYSNLAHVLETVGSSSEAQLEYLAPTKAEIDRVEALIAVEQEKWQQEIDKRSNVVSEMGFEQLGEEYDAAYILTKDSIKKLDEAKHQYSIARAIYDYASAGYLTYTDETVLSNEIENSQSIVDNSIDNNTNNQDNTQNDQSQSATIDTNAGSNTQATANAMNINPETTPTTEAPVDEVRQDLIDIINKVTPQERYNYVINKHQRAKAAYDALYTIIEDNKNTNYNVYENDETYRAYFDSYLKTYRESLAINKMNNVLNAAIARQEGITRRAHIEWQDARKSSFGDYRGLDNTDVTDDAGLNLVKDQLSGEWKVSWDESDNNVTTQETKDEYFLKTDIVYGLTDYEHDLNDWLRTLDDLKKSLGTSKFRDMMNRWSLALQHEEHNNKSAEDKDKYFKELLNHQQTDHTRQYMKDNGRATIEANWSSATSSIGNRGIPNEKELYDFFKLVQRTEKVSIKNSRENQDFNDVQWNLDVEAGYNTIKSDLHSEVAGHRARAAGYFVVAGINFGIAAALATPFSFWAAAPFFALGLLFTGFGVDQTYRANIKQDSANLNRDFANKSSNNLNGFRDTFESDINNIEALRDNYDKEQALLDLLKGEAGEGETVSREEQILRVADSVEAAFKLDHQDLNALLDKTEVVQGNDYKQSLRTLLTDYQGDVTDEEIETITSSSMAMSSLEKASDTRKNNKAKDMADYLNAVGGVADTQRSAVAKYQLEFRNFIIDPEADLTALNEAATAAFTKPSFSVREHLMRLYEGQKELADSILGDNQFSMSVSNDLLQSQNMLLAGNESMGIKGMFDYKYDAYRSVRHHEFDMMRLDHLERKEHWQSQMRAILARGQMEWRDGEKRLKGRYDEWTENVRREYKNKKESWDDKYLDFLDDKNTWLNVVSKQSTQIGDMSVLENFGDITQAAISDAGKDVIITTLSETAPDPSEILEEVVDMDLLDKLLENAESLNRGIKFFKPVIFTQLDGDKYTTAELMQSIKDFQGLQNEDYKKHVTKMEYQKMMDRLDAAEKNLEKQVDGANRGIDSSLHETMRKDGYILSGNVYKRDLIVGSTVIDGMLFETGYVNAYSDFTDFKVDFTSSVELTDDELDNMTSDSLDSLLDRAMQDIAKETKSIFGDAQDSSTILADAMGLDKNGNYVDHGDDKDAKKAAREADDKDEDESDNDPSYEFIQEIKWMEEITEQVSTRIVKEQSGNGVIEREVPVFATRYEERSATRGVDVSPGKFGSHVGYQPAFVDDVDFDKSWSDNVRFQGHGQMGTIMGQFIFNKMKEGMGIAMCNRPSYDQKFWDDRGDWLEAPTYRQTVEMATSVVSAVVPGPGLALTIAANAAFTVADVSNGVMDWDDAAVSFGKSTATAIVASKIGGSGIGKGATTVTGKVAAGFAKQAATNAATGAINAIEFDGKNFGYNTEKLAKSVVGKEALTGYATSALSTTITGNLNKSGLGFFDASSTQYQAFSNIAGSVAAQGLNYAVTGEATFNMLMLSDVFALAGAESKLGGADSGLFELHVTKDGTYGKFGTGGASIGVRNLYNSVLALDEVMANAKLAVNKKENKIALRALYSMDTPETRERFNQYVKGEANNKFGADIEGRGKTEGTSNGNKDVLISGRYGDDLDSQLDLAVVMAHEAYRDGKDNGEEGQVDETREAVFGHTDMARRLKDWFGDQYTMDDEVKANVDKLNEAEELGNMDVFYSHVDENYSSEEDSWKLVQRGSTYGWVKDGSLNYDVSLIGGVRYGLGQQTGDIINAEDMTPEMANALGLQLYGLNAIKETFSALDSETTYKWSHFAQGTMLFSDMGQIATQMIGGDLSQANVNNLNTALMNVQRSGLLFRTDSELYNSTSYPDIIKGGAGDSLFFPLPMNTNEMPIMTSELGYRLNLWDSRNPMHMEEHRGQDFAGRISPIINMGEGDLSLGYDRFYGLKMNSEFTNGGNQYNAQYGHMTPGSIMNYISVFASTGVSLGGGEYNDLGVYIGGKLSNVSGGIHIGNVGNTGVSTGPHSDLILNENGRDIRISGFFDFDVFPEHNYSKYLTGFQEEEFTNEVLDGFIKYDNIYGGYTYDQFFNFRYNNFEDQEYARKLIFNDPFVAW